MDPAHINIPPMMDLTIDNITDNTVIMNSQGSDQRLTYVMERLVTHLHDFARETRLSTSEWMATLNFLVRVGQISSEVRHVSLPFSIPLLTFIMENMS
jgi:Catechol dioxygenase N terminus